MDKPSREEDCNLVTVDLDNVSEEAGNESENLDRVVNCRIVCSYRVHYLKPVATASVPIVHATILVQKFVHIARLTAKLSYLDLSLQ